MGRCIPPSHDEMVHLGLLEEIKVGPRLFKTTPEQRAAWLKRCAERVREDGRGKPWQLLASQTRREDDFQVGEEEKEGARRARRERLRRERL